MVESRIPKQTHASTATIPFDYASSRKTVHFCVGNNPIKPSAPTCSFVGFSSTGDRLASSSWERRPAILPLPFLALFSVSDSEELVLERAGRPMTSVSETSNFLKSRPAAGFGAVFLGSTRSRTRADAGARSSRRDSAALGDVGGEDIVWWTSAWLTNPKAVWRSGEAERSRCE